jgi:hypothetical protein
MTPTMQQKLFWGAISMAIMACLLVPQAAVAANSAVWESGTSLIDTTNYTGLAPYYWFANFANASAVTGAPMDQSEVRNLPSWIHFETRPSCIGMADDCTTSDTTNRTGFSFSENTTNLTGATSIGGQPTFNNLTLPNAATGRSGEAVDSLSATGNTSTMANFRILAGAPTSFRMWVVTDNGDVGGGVYQDQARMRVGLRGTGGPPYTSDLDQVSAEALPSGQRIGNIALGHNGIADAWAFLFGDVNPDDLVTFQVSSAANSRPAFAGFMIEVVPEPASMVLVLLGTIGVGFVGGRRHRRQIR